MCRTKLSENIVCCGFVYKGIDKSNIYKYQYPLKGNLNE